MKPRRDLRRACSRSLFVLTALLPTISAIHAEISASFVCLHQQTPSTLEVAAQAYKVDLKAAADDTCAHAPVPSPAQQPEAAVTLIAPADPRLPIFFDAYLPKSQIVAVAATNPSVGLCPAVPSTSLASIAFSVPRAITTPFTKSTAIEHSRSATSSALTPATSLQSILSTSPAVCTNSELHIHAVSSASPLAEKVSETTSVTSRAPEVSDAAMTMADIFVEQISSASQPVVQPDATSTSSHPSVAATSEPVAFVLPYVASPKISKERFNFASFDCGALILAHNPEAGSATSILHNNKDAYMLNKCSASRFVTVELCNDILVDTIMLANFEFFSSMFKDFQVHVSDRYPPKNDSWTLLGDFRANNVRDFQYFKVENPRIWARYLRVTLVSEYGHEHYCPLSMLRVYGTTMMEEMKAEEEKAIDGENVVLPVEEMPEPEPLPTLIVDERAARQSKPLPTAPKAGQPIGVSRLPPLVGGIHNVIARESPVSRIDLMDAFGSALPTFLSSGVPGGGASSATSSRILVPEDFYAAMSSEHHSGKGDHDSLLASIAPPVEDIPGDRDRGSGSTSSHSHPAQPPGGTQESIFKTIMKRINTLERNITLQYVFLNEQSKALTDVFAHSLLREQERFDALLGHFNSTLFHIFTDLHIEYTRSWALLAADVEMEARRADAKLGEVDRLIGSLQRQMSRQFSLQWLITGAIASGWLISSMCRRRPVRLEELSSSSVLQQETYEEPLEHVDAMERHSTLEVQREHQLSMGASITFDDSSMRTPGASPVKYVMRHDKTYSITRSLLLRLSDSKSSLKKKRKRRRSTIAPQQQQQQTTTQSFALASKSESSLHKRRNSFSPAGLRTSIYSMATRAWNQSPDGATSGGLW
ncbi:hypothetical protein HKX48_001187 [Thoreauomyces humboldtii]|nr:hypothetical protein HKX48_001187 [Thoreauomyces humboldtii]